MLKYIDTRLDKFFSKNSPLHNDMNYYNVMWQEIFSYLELIEKTQPDEFDYELKRCRDLKNSIDFAYEKGLKKGKIEAKNVNV